MIATKVGFDLTQRDRLGGVDSRPDHVLKTTDECLKRLGTDYIDLLYQHRVDPLVRPRTLPGPATARLASN